MNRKQSIAVIVGVVLLTLVTRQLATRCEGGARPYQRLEGFTFHTVYHITYQGTADWHDSIRVLFGEVDASLSMFNPESVIARMNAGDTAVRADDHFRRVFRTAQVVSGRTGGAFDMTVAPLVNLWGFGFKNRGTVTDADVDSLLRYVGWQGVELTPDGRLVKAHAETVLDASSIAKGYACDVVARFLERHGCTDYMVEVGGEIALRGVNPQGRPWGVGINRPTPDAPDGAQPEAPRLEGVLHLTGGGIATSGNYRNFYYEGGRRYAHTIDPATGRPVQHDILSATVIAPDCMTADAYATAFMVMGSQRALAVLEADPTLMGYFIVAADSTDADSLRIIYSPALAERL